MSEGLNQIIDAINSEESEEEDVEEVEEEIEAPKPEIKPVAKFTAKKVGVMQKLRNVANNLTQTANDIP